MRVTHVTHAVGFRNVVSADSSAIGARCDIGARKVRVIKISKVHLVPKYRLVIDL